MTEHPLRSSPWERLSHVPRWPVPSHYNAVQDACDRHPRDKLAMIWDEDRGDARKIYWGEMQDMSARLANLLREESMEVGSRVVVILQQSPLAAAVTVAVLRAGAVLVTISERLGDAQIRERIEDLDPHLLITSTELADRITGLTPVRALLVDRVDLSRYASSFQTVKTLAESPAFIAYTSGTTSSAKGVVLPHRVMLGGEELSYIQDLRDGEVYYGIGEWSWYIRKILGPWQRGAVNLVYQTDRYDPEKMLRVLARHGVTNALINATAIRIMMRDRTIGTRCPQRFRVVTTSNEPLGEEASEWFTGQFGTTPMEFYGCTEVGAMVGDSPFVAKKHGSTGMPLPGCHVRILDEDGRECPPGREGEICLLTNSNPNYPLGYWGKPEETERDFGGQWYHTKDIARYDEDGYFWYVGRKDDVIKAAGYRVGPHEVETVLRQHQSISEAAVIGVPDKERGSKIVAYVVAKDGVTPDDGLTRELQQTVRERHSRFAYPKEVIFVPQLPRSSTGKLDRASLRKRYSDKPDSK